MAKGTRRKFAAPSLEALEGMTPEDRARVLENALRLRDQATIDLIRSSGLPLRREGGGMSKDDPIYLEMEQIIWSREAKDAAIAATIDGQPAMAGVDPILQRRMGLRYTPKHQGTMTAGSLVADMMRFEGYENDAEAPLPEGCIARTAMRFRTRRPR